MIKTNLRTKYIIIEGKMGVFLGTYALADLYDDDEIDITEISETEYNKSYAVFASDNPLGIPIAMSFENLNDAEEFIKDAFKGTNNLKLMPVPIETKNHNPDVIDIIKSGYGEFTFDMMDGLPSASDQIH